MATHACYVRFYNYTSFPFNLYDDDKIHGSWPTEPPDSLPAATQNSSGVTIPSVSFCEVEYYDNEDSPQAKLYYSAEGGAQLKAWFKCGYGDDNEGEWLTLDSGNNPGLQFFTVWFGSSENDGGGVWTWDKNEVPEHDEPCGFNYFIIPNGFKSPPKPVGLPSGYTSPPVLNPS